MLYLEPFFFFFFKINSSVCRFVCLLVYHSFVWSFILFCLSVYSFICSVVHVLVFHLCARLFVALFVSFDHSFGRLCSFVCLLLSKGNPV